jgi:antitoxin component of RelBE/YafQ-DinJ toxin-antitoxin module
MTKKTNITIPAPNDLKERFEAYREKHGLSKSDAGRKLLRQSLGSNTTNSKTTIGIRVPEDLEERFEAYREQHGLSKSDAGRKLLWQSLKAEQQKDPTSVSSRSDDLGSMNGLLLAGVVFALVLELLSVYLLLG